LSAEGRHRPTRAEVSAPAIGRNVSALRAVVGSASLCAVVKGDGYGHGGPRVAEAALAAGAGSLAVAVVDEGVELRDAGVTAPILLLSEAVPDAVADALGSGLTLTVGSLEGARDVVRAAEAIGGRHSVHVKVDTGMHRMGVAPNAVDEVIDVLTQSTAIDLEGLFTHFSVAEGSGSEDRAFTRGQIARFDEVVASLVERQRRPRVLHLSNSAGALGYPEARRSMVRVGLSLYGYLPSSWLGAALEEKGVRLEPALTIRSRVVALRRVAAGERPSYGRRRALEREATVATVPIGYADGYPRKLFEGGAEVLIREKRYPLAGAVTMDQLLVDVGDDEVALGDDVVLLGRQGSETITADDWAGWAETISWEVLARIGARVPRVTVG